MELTKQLILLVGIPGSGKSTWARKYIQEHPDTWWISRDTIRYELLGGIDKVTSKNYYSKENQTKATFIKGINMALAKGHSVIADATHINSASRKSLLHKIYEYRNSTIAVYFDVPYPICKERNKSREGILCVPDSGMQNMHSKLSCPTFDEGFSNIIIVDQFGDIVKKMG